MTNRGRASERYYDVTHWTEPAVAGHFAALEQPDLLVEDLRAFFRELRSVQATAILSSRWFFSNQIKYLPDGNSA